MLRLSLLVISMRMLASTAAGILCDWRIDLSLGVNLAMMDFRVSGKDAKTNSFFDIYRRFCVSRGCGIIHF